MKLEYISNPEVNVISETPPVVEMNGHTIEGMMADVLIDDVYDENIADDYTMAIDRDGTIEQVWIGKGIPERFQDRWLIAYPNLLDTLKDE